VGAAQLVDLFAGENDPAVHDAADDRRHLTCSHCDHRFVEQAEAFCYTSALREHRALNVHGEREEVAVAETLADFGGRGSRFSRAVEVTAQLVLKADRQEHVTLLDTLALLALEQPLSAAEPARGRPHLTAERKVHADPERAADCGQRLALFRVRVVRALQQRNPFVDEPEHVGRRRQQHEVRAGQGSRAFDVPQQLVGLTPRGSRVGIPASFQLVSGLQETQSPSNRVDRKVKLFLTKGSAYIPSMEAALKAIAAPRRRQILTLVRDDELSAGEIASHFDVTRPAVSQHLNVLKEAGLVSERRNGTRRLYRARPEGLADLKDFLEEFWDVRLETLKREAEEEERKKHGRSN
jgi:DNA-binding transcriptional ArsR family regulator